jgi:yncE
LKRGVSFCIPNEWGKYLCDVLKPVICTHRFYWEIYDDEAWKKIDGVELELFKKRKYISDEFNRLISSGEYYIVSGRLAAYDAFEGCSSKFSTYEDFQKSCCQILLFITDSIFIEIYCKNLQYTNILYENAIEKNFSAIEYITDENDGRTEF